MMRQKKDVSVIDKAIWNKAVHFKMAFITWKAVHDKIPTHERVGRMEKTVSSRCGCCNALVLENTEHLFCLGEFAKSIWQVFCSPFGISFKDKLFLQLLQEWWNQWTFNSITTFIAKTIPQLITWEL